ncbi:MAG: chromophore lyase CpcT/CpeT [Candidatus Eisenbacteria bacterium]|jgi:hypothetical protein|nr:chromophore lyase CpcT/CpeT [Candidatus Eisenbacteria bacterium]
MAWQTCALVALLVFGAAAQDGESDLRTLATWMCGSFSSGAQAREDAEYLDIKLNMVRIWPARDDGYWLYVEQAVAWSQNEPYRQRVYHLTHVGADIYQSEVFELRDPLRFAGAWRTDAPLSDQSPDSLEARQGCAIILRKHGDAFIGCTLGRLCESTLRGAAFATSEVEITEMHLLSWDRGFAATGAQVWGAEKGGYVFEKTADHALD